MSENLILSGAPEGMDAALLAQEAQAAAGRGAAVVHVARDGDRVDSLLADRTGRRLALSHATAPLVEIAER